jgi:hypothetical protein
MWHSGRRLLVTPGWAHARQMFAAVIAERDQLKHELEWTKQALNEVRAALRELQAAVQSGRDRLARPGRPSGMCSSGNDSGCAPTARLSADLEAYRGCGTRAAGADLGSVANY